MVRGGACQSPICSRRIMQRIKRQRMTFPQGEIHRMLAPRSVTGRRSRPDRGDIFTCISARRLPLHLPPRPPPRLFRQITQRALQRQQPSVQTFRTDHIVRRGDHHRLENLHLIEKPDTRLSPCRTSRLKPFARIEQRKCRNPSPRPARHIPRDHRRSARRGNPRLNPENLFHNNNQPPQSRLGRAQNPPRRRPLTPRHHRVPRHRQQQREHPQQHITVSVDCQCPVHTVPLDCYSGDK